MSVRERNLRVLQRVGARPLTGAKLKEEAAVLTVPANIVLEPSLFAVLADLRPPRRLRAVDGSELDWSAGEAELPLLQLEQDDFMDGSARRRTERVLLERTEKPSDGPVSRRFNRPQSRFFSRWLLRAGLGPNAASAMSLLLGLVCGYVAAQPGWLWLAGLLFQFASMFDGVDGEMARVTLRESKRGAAIDTLVDNLTYALTLLGFGIGWAEEGLGVWEGRALVLVSGLVLLTLFQVLLFVRKYAPNASFVFFDRSVERAAETGGGRGLRFIRVVFLFLRRDLLAFLLMWLCFFGSRVLIIGLVGLGVAVANYVLWACRNDLVRAARDLQQEPAIGAGDFR